MTHEEHIIIGKDRHITVPKELQRIAVQYDHNVETVTFDCPRYWDNIDMSKMTVYINYMRKDRARGKAEAKNVVVDENDSTIMHFDWTIRRNATLYKGELKFLVCIVDVDSDGNEKHHWNSELNNQMYVSEGLECDEAIKELHADIITDLLVRMDKILIANSPILDKTLTESGLAADAKVVGDRLLDIVQDMSDGYSELAMDISTESDTLSKAISKETTDRKTEIAVERARINKFVALKNGSTTGDAELMDLRIGADSTTYDSAGEAVRQQFTRLNNELRGVNEVPFEWIQGGYMTTYGTVMSHESYMYTDYISLYNGNLFLPIYYDLMLFRNTVICLYNANKEFISYIAVESDTLVQTTGIIGKEYGAHYIRATCNRHYAGSLTRGPINLMAIEIRDGEVTTSKVANGAITLNKLANYKHIGSTNFIDKSALISDSYINGDGVIKSTSKLSVTDKIPLTPGVSYYWNGLLTGYYAFYAYNDEVIEAHNNDETLAMPLVAPEGTSYGRFTIHESQLTTSWLHINNVKPPEYEKALYDVKIIDSVKEKPTEYLGCDICAFHTGVCIGDSLTAGTMNYYTEENGIANYVNYDVFSYPSNLERMTGISIVNLGLGGKTSDEWYDAKKDSDLSGYDFAIIQLGVNDVNRYKGWTSASVNGFTNIINKLRSENANIKIFVSTIIPAISYSGELFDAVSQGIRNLVLTFNDPNVILLDMAVYGHTKELDAYNCGHLSAYGYWRLAADYKAYISWYMNANPNVFREIQFIGTEYHFEH